MSAPTQLLLRGLVSLLVAVAILVLAVLPAEYGYDPTGVGERLGLTGLAATPSGALATQQTTLAHDTFTFELLPFESLEYKYRLDKGAVMVFSWQATGEVVYDLHAEPDGAGSGVAESFAQGKSLAESGSYQAQFAGIHGWFWENRRQQKINVTMVSSGFFTAATLFRDGHEYRREVELAGLSDAQ